ncbi:MAG: hypothetical protein M1524_02980 [Patescibacteria group bacterium]|nr:hypothetical protein [Patescibacteria group bacterium]
MIAKSRLSRNYERQSKKNFILSILGIIIVLVLLIKFGIPMIVNFSLFISNFRENQSTSEKKSEEFISAPVLDPLPNATNSAKTVITGIASSNQTVNLYINNELFDKTDSEDDGKFTFEDVTLDDGNNTIKARVVIDNSKKSDFSDEINIVYKNKAPNLTIDSPTDGQTFSKTENQIQIRGKTDPAVKVTVNDFWVIVDENGNFSYEISLKEGDNQIKVSATDEAGNNKTTELKVKYSP